MMQTTSRKLASWFWRGHSFHWCMYDSVKGRSRDADQDARLCWVQCSVEAVKRDQSLNKQSSRATGRHRNRHRQRGVEKDHEKRKKKRNQSNCEKSGGGLSETGHGKEGRVDSHGPAFFLVLFCPALVSCVCTSWIPDALRWLLIPFYGVQPVENLACFKPWARDEYLLMTLRVRMKYACIFQSSPWA
ncbi:hypothetical protein M440DRAFT_1045204 [Trichoderma longibrachiatum ATCC 18648]|uniref:Uncharacterized protein n=1 Tax=Trichoderma longibrachiatum ATCC 18648 TaxID=983965 RepID=A0A2T4BYM2_TRILO|nr:hypothetical protein M440DRAFT_1045204 [Trichoderma longibrachiatum ATCC 18648]